MIAEKHTGLHVMIAEKHTGLHVTIVQKHTGLHVMIAEKHIGLHVMIAEKHTSGTVVLSHKGFKLSCALFNKGNILFQKRVCKVNYTVGAPRLVWQGEVRGPGTLPEPPRLVGQWEVPQKLSAESPESESRLGRTARTQ